MNNLISTEKLIEILKRNSIGRSISYPMGFVKGNMIIELGNLVEQDAINEFGNEIKSHEA